MSVREIRSVRVIYRDGGQWEYGPAHFSLLPAPDRIALARALVAALTAAVECGIVPNSTAANGGACAYSRQACVADQIRAAIASATPEADNAGS